MNLFEKIYSFLFVSVMLGCVFFRIESWPFSDWRVYELAMKPEYVQYFIVKIVEGEKESEPYTGTSYGLKINEEFKSRYNRGDQEGIQAYCETLFESLKENSQIDKMEVQRATTNQDIELQYQTICVR